MSDQPAPAPDHSIETVWLVQCTYGPDPIEARKPYRAAHLARVAELRRQGVIIEAGAYTDASASFLLLRAADEAEALDIVRQDIYMQNGVWVEARAKPFGRVRLAEES